MKRREFIRNSTIFSASTFLMPTFGCSSFEEKRIPFQPLESLQLSDFNDEQDESPILFQNNQGSFLTTLRRKEYPSEKEIISLFKLEDGNWKEQNPVTSEEGSYEAIHADCHADGKPAVTWTEINKNQWVIKVAIQGNNGFSTPVSISDPSKRSINPVIKAVTSDSYLLAWESFEQGKFRIYLAKYENSSWSDPVLITDKSKSSFHPAVNQDELGNIYVAYDFTDGPHRNVEMKIFTPGLKEIKTVPIAIGGGFKDRVNINVKPALAFDKEGTLWISWENNRDAHRLQDSDNYTGDRCCAMVCYRKDQLWEQKETGRWLFKEKNDHWPTFQKDLEDNLYLVTHCGGDFVGNPHWKFRVSYLDSTTGWSEPVTILQTKQKGESIKPTLVFDSDSFWLAWKSEQFKDRDYDNPGDYDKKGSKARRGMLEMNKFYVPDI